MTRKKKIKLSILGIILILMGILTYELLFGKLFPFSPVIIGFTKHELNNTIIYVQNGADYTDFQRIDTLTSSVEKFHELQFKKKPEIFIFKDSLYFIRHSFSKARFSAYPSGRLVVSPWAVREDREGKISIEIYVRHELSHVLLMQYMSYLKAYNYPQWMMEGIAVYSTNQMGTSFYPSKEETYHYIAEGNFLPPLDFKTDKEDNVILNVKNPIAFKYSEFACIVDYLAATYGKEKLLLFMKKLFENSDNDEVFKEVYNIEFSKVIQDFKKQVIEIEQSKEQISRVVRTVFQDSRGNIWFGTQNGAFRLTDKSLNHIDSIKSELGKEVTIKDITEDKEGTIWFGHTDGISSIKGETVTNYYESDGLISNDVWSITAVTNGNIWIGTIKGACIFNGQEFTNFKLPEGKIDSTLGVSSTKMVHNITEDSKGVIWLSSNAGLFSYSDNKLINVSEKFGILTNFVNEIFEDRNGEIWVSTKKGLYKLTENNAINITGDRIETGKGIGSIAEDKNGKIWFVSNQHFLFTFGGNELKEFQKSEENKGPVVFQIYKDQYDRLWFVGYGGAYRLENGKFINITKNGPW